LQFEYGTSAEATIAMTSSTSWTITNLTGTTPKKDYLTFSFSGASSGYIQASNTFTVMANKRYQVELLINPSCGFPTNLDSLRFSLKSTSGEVMGSESFLPRPESLKLIIPVASSGTVSPIIEYYTHGSGSFKIQSVKVTCVDAGSYTWTFNPSTAEKQNIKIVRVHLFTRSKGSTGTKFSNSVQVGNVSLNVFGEYSFQLYKEMIQTPNNGNSNLNGISGTSGFQRIDLKIRPELLSIQF